LATGIPARLTPAEGRKFGLLVGGAFLLLAAILWRGSHGALAWIAGLVGAGLVLGGGLAPSRLGPVYRAWMAVALAISKVTTPIFMGIIYFLVITPAGFLTRVVGHRPLVRRRNADTFWKSRPPGARRGDMNHQF
jgi:hypothetical protein